MTRRGLFGALLGGIAAATGVNSLANLPRFGVGRRLVFRKTASAGRTDQLVTRLLIADETDPYPFPTLLTGRAVHLDSPLALATNEVDLADVADAASTAPADMPPTWPDHHEVIDATAELSPVAQMKRLVDLFGSSGEAGPAFVEALIGELVLTRVRLAAADPRVLCSFEPVAA